MTKDGFITGTFFLIAAIVVSTVSIQTSYSQVNELMNSEIFIKAVTGGDAAKVTSMLRSNPQLASTRDTNGRSAVLLAIYYGKKDIASILVESGISLTIFEAAAIGETKVVKSLITKDKSQIDAYAPDGFFPLGLAIFFGHPETALALLEAGAKVNLASKESMRVTPLHTAVAAHQLLIARELIKRGANVNARSENDFVPLHEASARGELEFAKLLLDNGADINAKTKDGKTPLEFAISANKPEMVKFLRKRGTK